MSQRRNSILPLRCHCGRLNASLSLQPILSDNSHLHNNFNAVEDPDDKPKRDEMHMRICTCTTCRTTTGQPIVALLVLPLTAVTASLFASFSPKQPLTLAADDQAGETGVSTNIKPAIVAAHAAATRMGLREYVPTKGRSVYFCPGCGAHVFYLVSDAEKDEEHSGSVEKSGGWCGIYAGIVDVKFDTLWKEYRWSRARGGCGSGEGDEDEVREDINVVASALTKGWARAIPCRARGVQTQHAVHSERTA